MRIQNLIYAYCQLLLEFCYDIFLRVFNETTKKDNRILSLPIFGLNLDLRNLTISRNKKAVKLFLNNLWQRQLYDLAGEIDWANM